MVILSTFILFRETTKWVSLVTRRVESTWDPWTVTCERVLGGDCRSLARPTPDKTPTRDTEKREPTAIGRTKARTGVGTPVTLGWSTFLVSEGKSVRGARRLVEEVMAPKGTDRLTTRAIVVR